MKSYLLKAPESDFESWTTQAHESGQSLAAWIRDRLNSPVGIAQRTERDVAVEDGGSTPPPHGDQKAEESKELLGAVLAVRPAFECTFKPDPKPEKKRKGR